LLPLFSIPERHLHPPEHEVDQFEDDPLEFIRLDLSSTSFSADSSTPRQAAADVLQALVNSGYEAETTAIVATWISAGLQEYSTNPLQNWKAKDTAEYLFTAVATRGSTTQVRRPSFFELASDFLTAWRHRDESPRRRDQVLFG
jgi:hypothetical protein